MKKDFWKGRKVLITGHTGFKGSWLSLWLQGLGSEIVGFGLQPPTTPNLFENATVASGMTSIIGDIRDFNRFKGVIAETEPEIIIHMAAQSVIRHSYVDPLETYTTNVIGTANLLEILRQTRRRCAVVNVTSDKCYENREWIWGYRETDPLGGHDPYSNSKACAELVTSAFRDSFFREGNIAGQEILVATARAGNVIGGGDWTPYQLVPDVMRAFLDNRPVSIRRPGSIRPWQFVLEPITGYLTLAESLWEKGDAFASGWNFGPGEEGAKPVSWLVNKLVELWGNGAGWLRESEDDFHEAGYLKLDSSKSRNLLGWKPVTEIENGLEWVVEWYKAYREGKDLRDLTVGQIARYENLLQSQTSPPIGLS